MKYKSNIYTHFMNNRQMNTDYEQSMINIVNQTYDIDDESSFALHQQMLRKSPWLRSRSKNQPNNRFLSHHLSLLFLFLSHFTH
jgi:hypothetical protein